MSQRRHQVKRARRAYPCKATNWSIGRWREGRGWDGGRVPPDHTPEIAPGALYVQWQQYGEPQRCCEPCARAAGLLP